MEQVAKTNVKPQANEHAAEKTAEEKAKKAASAKAWKEKKDKEAAERRATAADLIKYLDEKKIVLPDNFAKLLNDIANPATRAAGSNGNSVFEKLFGTTPKVGDKVTLMQVFQKTLKSKAEIDRAVKNWQEKGIIVEFKAAANQLESTYEIKKLA